MVSTRVEVLRFHARGRKPGNGSQQIFRFYFSTNPRRYTQSEAPYSSVYSTGLMRRF